MLHIGGGRLMGRQRIGRVNLLKQLDDFGIPEVVFNERLPFSSGTAGVGS